MYLASLEILCLCQNLPKINVFFEFHANNCFVKSQVSKEVLLEGFMGTSGLYCFSTQPVKSSAANIVSMSSKDQSTKFSNTCSNKLSMWHNIIGHTNFVALKSILKLCKISLH